MQLFNYSIFNQPFVQSIFHNCINAFLPCFFPSFLPLIVDDAFLHFVILSCLHLFITVQKKCILLEIFVRKKLFDKNR